VGQPVPVSGLQQVTQLAASSLHACALLADGSVWCWGDSEGRSPRLRPKL
jgi:alpha-tubulin suppressor-like RCC1 family protein